MKRKIINIDKTKCNGCGACAKACHEGAIGMIDGKATLLRDDYCDGFGDCLPKCPTGAITFIEKDTLPYNEQAVLENKKKASAQAAKTHVCPGMLARTIRQNTVQKKRCDNRVAVYACAMALPDKTCAYIRAVFSRLTYSHCGGLHGIRIRKRTRRFYERQSHSNRLSQTRRRRLFRKTLSNL